MPVFSANSRSACEAPDAHHAGPGEDERPLRLVDELDGAGEALLVGRLRLVEPGQVHGLGVVEVGLRLLGVLA